MHAIVTIVVTASEPDGSEHTWRVEIELTAGRPSARRGHPDRWAEGYGAEVDVLRGERDDGLELAGPAMEAHLVRRGVTTERLGALAEDHVQDARLAAMAEL